MIAPPSTRRATCCSKIGLPASHVTELIPCDGISCAMNLVRKCMLAGAKTKTPREIAASVMKTREHAELELALRELRGQLEARQAEVRALTARSRDSDRLDREVVAKGGEVSELRKQRDALAAKLAPMRRAHGERVVAALRPLRQEAASSSARVVGSAAHRVRAARCGHGRDRARGRQCGAYRCAVARCC